MRALLSSETVQQNKKAQRQTHIIRGIVLGGYIILTLPSFTQKFFNEVVNVDNVITDS